MKRIVKILLLSGFLSGSVFYSFADRGFTKKSRSKVAINIDTRPGFKKSLPLNLSGGLKYTGSLVSTSQKDRFTALSNNVITYQKGNTIYIMPVKQKIVVSEMKPGYAGMKLIIKSN